MSRNPRIDNRRSLHIILLEDPTINDTCSNCDILPICNGGGCTIYRKNHKYKPTCKFYKDTLIKQVIDTFDNLQDNIDR